MQRRAAADPTFFKRVCWVDQKQVYLVSSYQDFRRWCQRHGIEEPSQQDLVLECTHMDGKYSNWVAYYYAIVNADLGPFYICITGTYGAGAPEFNFEASYRNQHLPVFVIIGLRLYDGEKSTKHFTPASLADLNASMNMRS